MIPISLTTALVFYSSILGALVLAIWIFTEVSVRRTYRVMGKQFLWRCVFCGYIYLDEKAEELSRCPRCESFNSVSDKKARFVKARPQKQEPGKKESASEIAAGSERNTSRRKRPHQRRRGPRKR